jgi:uncharacterized membrane-anchored protein
MDFPQSVLQGLNYKASATEAEPVKSATNSWNTTQHNEIKEPCPVGCKRSKATLALSKPTPRAKPRFVKVFHKENKLKAEETLEEKRKRFWAEIEKIQARSIPKPKSIVL